MTVADLVWIDSAGYHYADYPSFLAWITGKYTGVYGTDAYLGASSQDGQWLGIIAQALYDTAAYGGSIYNSFSPTTGQGVGLSRNVKINGLNRQSATQSTVELLIGGTVFTNIVNGKAIDDLQQVWDLPASVTIPEAGEITVTATAELPGAIQAQAGTIQDIFTPTLGWQTVNNPAAATAGQAAESDGNLRNRQRISTSIPAQTVFDATIGAVGNVPGVTALAPYENDTDITDGDGLPPHSISLVVQGGTDDAIAQTILDYKTPGTNTYGTTEIPLTDAKGIPITIRFFRPVLAPIGVKVSLTTLQGWITSNEDIIAQALADYISALPIGDTIVLTKLYAIAYVPGTTAFGTFNIEAIEISQAAHGTITLTGVPSTSNPDTITVGGTAITFVASSPTGSQVLVGADAAETAENLFEFLAASNNVNIEKCTYSIDGAIITLKFKSPGPTGNSFTLAKSSSEISISGGVLTGGAFGSTDVDLAFNVLATCNPDDVGFDFI